MKKILVILSLIAVCCLLVSCLESVPKELLDKLQGDLSNSGNIGGSDSDNENPDDTETPGNGENSDGSDEVHKHTPAKPVRENEVAATCTEEGYYDEVVYCDECKEEISRVEKTTAVVKHTPKDAIKENEVLPTCNTKGSYNLVVYCDICGEVVSSEFVTIEEKGHTPKDAIKENEVLPTCDKKGSYDLVVYCDVCGETVSTETVTVEEKGHTPKDAIKENEVLPTCNKEGSYDLVVYCVVCEGEISRVTESISKLTHKFVGNECSLCGELKESEGLSFTLSSDKTYYIVSNEGTCNDRHIVIPSSFNGLPVKEIGQNAFIWKSDIKGITLPESITSINDSAFKGCTGLTSITIPKGITSINYQTFDGCTSLTSITLPNGITSIGARAFFDCRSLKSITLPESITSIDGASFLGCTSLKSITIPKNVTSIGNNAFYGCDKLFEVYNLSDLDITAGSDENGYVGYYALYIYTSLDEEKRTFETEDGFIFFENGDTGYLMGYVGNGTDIVLPESCNGKKYSIYANAFDGCTDLTSVTISSGVTSIGEYAFRGCESLSTLTIGENVDSIGDYAFESCDSLEDVYISSIGSWCNISFGEYYSNPLENRACTVYLNGEVITGDIVIPDGVTNIPANTFRNSTITSIIIPDSITSIGASALNECDNLQYNEYGNAYYLGNENNPYLVLVKAKDREITSCTIHNGTRIIYCDAFYKCTSLTSITIPDSVTSIGNRAFYECTNLTSVTIGNGVTSIASYAFSKCTSLTRITIPNSVTSIEFPAFSNCTALEEVYFNATEANDADNAFSGAGTKGNGIKVVIGKNVTKIPDLLFQGVNVISVEFEEGSVCESIGKYAFSDCTNLTSVTIPNSVTLIGLHSFSNCTSLKKITISNNVTSISNYAFENCTGLEEIYYDATETDNPIDVFKNAGTKENGIKIVIGKNVTKISYSLFYGVNVVSVEFEEGSVCESIGEYAFAYCTNLTSVTIPNSVTSISYSAFSGCRSLTNVYYTGTSEEWNEISIGNSNTPLTSATVYYYSATEPTEEGNYWYYDENGAVTLWN